MQINTIRYHHKLLKWLKLKTDKIKYLYKCGVTGTLVQSLWKPWQFLVKLKIHHLYDPEISLLGIYPREIKSYVYEKSCTRMFIAALK